MANNWNIPKILEEEVRARDKTCVYCGTFFTLIKECRKRAASWEHIVNDASIITRENIALCCCGCNSSKGKKELLDWLDSKYCKERNINFNTVSDVIKKAILEAKSV